MGSKWVWWLSNVVRRIWFRATLFSVLAVATALVAIVLSPFIPSDLPTKIGADAVDKILGVIASSMLTVTTFSLSTMVSAYSAATSNVTPRATRLVMEDSTTQNVLATFVGSFLFSLVGIIALTTGAYGEQGRLVLFVVTLVVIVLIVVTLLRWIDHLSRLGRVTETTERVEQAATAAMREWWQNPNLGGHTLTDDRRERAMRGVAVTQDRVGYVQHVDAGALNAIADEVGIELVILAIPGKLVFPAEPLAWVDGHVEDKLLEKIVSCFSIGDIRSFDQDPRFGASVLTEIASRALSPAVNDPGTAIDVIARASRLLAVWTEKRETDEIVHGRLHVAPISVSDLFDDLFTPIARDGAGTVEVGIRLQKALASLARLDPALFGAQAMRHAQEALARGEVALLIDGDKERLREAAAHVGR
jgi:uncharacterized membrane protein